MARGMEPLFIYFESRSHGMELEEVIEGLRAEKGVVFVDVFPDQLFDKVVAVMKQTGHDLPSLYKETGEGGLAKDYEQM